VIATILSYIRQQQPSITEETLRWPAIDSAGSSCVWRIARCSVAAAQDIPVAVPLGYPAGFVSGRSHRVRSRAIEGNAHPVRFCTPDAETHLRLRHARSCPHAYRGNTSGPGDLRYTCEVAKGSIMRPRAKSTGYQWPCRTKAVNGQGRWYKVADEAEFGGPARCLTVMPGAAPGDEGEQPTSHRRISHPDRHGAQVDHDT